jgi:glyoxylase-like metal-dependent hydrolase (beta-lactamase superfamily II)
MQRVRRLWLAVVVIILTGGVLAQVAVTRADAQASVVSTAQGPATMPSSRHFHVEMLAPGVWAAINNDNGGWLICNAGIVDLGDRTVVIDPGMTPAAARDLKAAAEALTKRPVTLVVNTHWHNDHVRGNQVFVPGAEILGTPRMRADVLEREPLVIADEKKTAPTRLRGLEARLAAGATGADAADARLFVPYYRGMLDSHAELVPTPPTTVADRDIVVHGSVRRLELRLMGEGHTTSDVVAYLPDERIAFPGDLVFVGRHPYLPDGMPDGWRRALRTMQR